MSTILILMVHKCKDVALKESNTIILYLSNILIVNKHCQTTARGIVKPRKQATSEGCAQLACRRDVHTGSVHPPDVACFWGGKNNVL